MEAITLSVKIFINGVILILSNIVIMSDSVDPSEERFPGFRFLVLDVSILILQRNVAYDPDGGVYRDTISIAAVDCLGLSVSERKEKAKGQGGTEFIQEEDFDP